MLLSNRILYSVKSLIRAGKRLKAIIGISEAMKYLVQLGSSDMYHLQHFLHFRHRHLVSAFAALAAV